ncbi:DUF1360 domain-containing protein [Mycolicibacterium conceptionense]|uniref:DUF1360 domain-containing protein n=1 Tax=Mycolicibacterium conceptionense TaxID=451644 RepID=UPI00096EE6A8|nr:DUF1360 domain-containing protein [Mycolicibacterium conceptionense]OMB79276.1 hypothetical protein A5743_14325 [Mycolicibacterium conceptionense]
MNHTIGMTLLVLAVYVLAVMRLVRLINYDTILDPLRLWIARRANAARAAAAEADAADMPTQFAVFDRRMARWNLLAHFLKCPWCVGFWGSLVTAVVPVLVIGWPWWSVFGVALACSYLVGLAAPLTEDDLEIVDDSADGQ